ncbi:Monocarboxylate transporter 12-B [Operophtera brumata]|uniref:Monocarboxylate transporter 12-B n=1 Tax=Operophtera brumata TaxID=104452 RepID=A0A0L7L0W2_OPEBR|nr:Monocarboxylate transporter 12-B [Operophtera brumata]
MTVEKSKGDGKMPATRKVAPDGGWAWMVCLGVSLVNFSTRSLEPSFGLLFKDLLDDLGVKTTGASVIASTLDSVVNFSGFFVGPVIKTFSYRKVCFVGSTICALGLLFTAPANSMAHILATYSILGGEWTVVILGALAFHAVLGSCLLQPVKRHLIDEMECILESDEEADDKFEINPLVKHPLQKLTTQRSHTNMNHPSVRTIGMPRAKTCDKPLQDFGNPSLYADHAALPYKHEPPLSVDDRHAAGQDVRQTATGLWQPQPICMSEAARRRKFSVISNISNMDFTGSYLQLYLDPFYKLTASVAAMPRVTSSGSMSEAARRRKVSVISIISNMDFTGSYLQLYLDVGDAILQTYRVGSRHASCHVERQHERSCAQAQGVRHLQHIQHGLHGQLPAALSRCR